MSEHQEPQVVAENHHVENHFLLAYLLLEPQEQNPLQAEKNETKGQEHEILEGSEDDDSVAILAQAALVQV